MEPFTKLPDSVSTTSQNLSSKATEEAYLGATEIAQRVILLASLTI